MCVIHKGDKKCLLFGIIFSLLLGGAGGVLYFIKGENEYTKPMAAFALLFLWIFIWGYFKGYNLCNRIASGAELGAATVDWVTSYQQDLLARQHGGVIYIGETDKKMDKVLKIASDHRRDEQSGKMDAPH